MKNLRKICEEKKRNNRKQLAESLILPWSRVELPILDKPENYPHFIHYIHDTLTEIKRRNDSKYFIPNFKDEKNLKSIAIFSDYGGEHNSSKYNTYSFLICAKDPLDLFFKQMSRIRSKHGLNKPYKEICYKNFNYGPLKRSLIEYLECCSLNIIGFTFTLVVSKEIDSIHAFYKSQKDIKEKLIEELKLINESEDVLKLVSKSKPHVISKQFIILHTISYLISLLAENGHNIVWQSDNDAIFSNEKQTEWCKSAFAQILSKYTNKDFPSIAVGTPIKELQKLNDLGSVPDLIAGAVEAYFSKVYDNPSSEDEDLKEEAIDIIKWLCLQGIGLKHLSLMIHLNKNGDPVCSTIDFNLKQSMNMRKVIYID